VPDFAWEQRMNWKFFHVRLGAFAAVALMAVPFASGAGVSGNAATASSCRAMLNVADARTLAENTPNARAFVQNFGAKLSTAVAHQGGGSVAVRVTADDAKQGQTEVGIYTVNLRTGHILDDDQEPAEDDQTAQVRQKLQEKHCGVGERAAK
jgi:hypothetical protein